jgi:beta-barrel assembly-enhancing protease
MRHTAAFRSVALATLLLVLASCVSTQVPPISSQGGAFKPTRDEQALWESSREEEKKLLENVKLYQDPLLDSYLGQVVSRLNPPGMAANPSIRYQVRVVENPTLNAFAYPHGSLYVHTGLLARMENEDELATVLGHEMTHVENRHMLRYQRAMLNKQIGLSIAAVAAAVVIADAEGDALGKGDWGQAATIDVLGNLIVGLGLQLAFLASVNGYGRGLEVEADQGGFVKMSAAGYDLQQAPKVYKALLDDRGEPKKVEAFFFGSHPRLSERVESTKAYVAKHPATPVDEAVRQEREDTFARRIRPVVRDDARLNIEMGRLTPRLPRRRIPPPSASSAATPRTPSASRSSSIPTAPPRTASWGSCSTSARPSARPAPSSAVTSSWPRTPTTRVASAITCWRWSGTATAGR